MPILYLFLALSSWASEKTLEKPIVIQLAGEPDTLDPLHVSDVLGFNIASNLYEGLFRLDGKGQLQKALAKSHSVSKDGLIHRFRLREEAQWSDGKKVTVDDFVYGLQRALDPKTAARDASLLQSVQEVQNEKNELVLRLKQPDPSLLQALTMPFAAPQRRDQAGPWNPKAPTTGPYHIALFKPDREIQLVPNPAHRGKALPLTFKVIPEETTALNLFETGGLDLLTTIPATEMARLKNSGLLQTSPSAATIFLSFHLGKAPFSDLRWRKALAHAIDRESLAKVQEGTIHPATSYLPSAIQGSLPYKKPSFPKELAWAKAQEKPTVSLVYASSALANLVVQRLQSDVEKTLGLHLKLEPMEWKAFLGRLQGDAPALFYLGYSAPFNDFISHLKVFRSEEPDNRSHFKSSEYDRLLEQAKKGDAVAARNAHRILVERELVILPLFERLMVHGVAKGVKGFQINPFGVMDLRQLRR